MKYDYETDYIVACNVVRTLMKLTNTSTEHIIEVFNMNALDPKVTHREIIAIIDYLLEKGQKIEEFDFGTLIKFNRIYKGMTQVGLAKAINMPYNFISYVETGKILPDKIKPNTLSKLMSVLDIEPYDISTLFENPTEESEGNEQSSILKRETNKNHPIEPENEYYVDKSTTSIHKTVNIPTVSETVDSITKNQDNDQSEAGIMKNEECEIVQDPEIAKSITDPQIRVFGLKFNKLSANSEEIEKLNDLAKTITYLNNNGYYFKLDITINEVKKS